MLKFILYYYWCLYISTKMFCYNHYYFKSSDGVFTSLNSINRLSCFFFIYYLICEVFVIRESNVIVTKPFEPWECTNASATTQTDALIEMRMISEFSYYLELTLNFTPAKIAIFDQNRRVFDSDIFISEHLRLDSNIFCLQTFLRHLLFAGMISI